MSDKIVEALGLEPYEPTEVIDLTTEEKHDMVQTFVDEQNAHSEAQSEVIDDVTVAKDNIKRALGKATEAYEALIAVAKESETARDFEVAATMLKSIVDANKEFVNMSEKKKYAKEELPSKKTEDAAGGTTNITNNNLIMSTAEVLKMFKGVN